MEGNGGDWFELVVVGDDGAGTMDLRGWKVEIGKDASFPFLPETMIEFSNHQFWASVPHGTILTFTEEKTATGGSDTLINGEDRSGTEGWSWSNIWVGDTQYLNYTSEAVNGYRVDPGTGAIADFDITSVRTQFVIRDGSGAIVHGPAGEGVGLTGGVSNRTVWELVGDPRADVTPDEVGDPLTGVPGAAADARASSFGQPNTWNGGVATQDFSVFLTPYDLYMLAAGLFGNDALPSADADGDGDTNGVEFATGSLADDAASRPFMRLADSPVRELTFLRRSGGAQSGNSYFVDGHYLVVEASSDLRHWIATALPGTVPPGLPAAPVGYEYASFAAPAELAGSEQVFFRISVAFVETYDDYIAAAGLSGPDALVSADPDGDEFANGLEYVLGSRAGDAGGVPSMGVSGPPSRELVFLRRRGGVQNGVVYDVGGFSVVVEASGDGQNWMETGIQGTVPAGWQTAPAGFEYVSFAPPVALAGSEEVYFRVRVIFP